MLGRGVRNNLLRFSSANDQSSRTTKSHTELTNKLLLLVELLKGLSIHCIKTNLASTIAIVSITKDANTHTRAGKMGKAHGAGETLVLLRVVVLQTDLEFDGLNELALGLLGALEHFINEGAELVSRDLARHGRLPGECGGSKGHDV